MKILPQNSGATTGNPIPEHQVLSSPLTAEPAMEYMTMVSNLLQAEFIDLLLQLPDEFFKFSEEQKNETWNAIHHALVHGVKDTKKLASLIDPLELCI